MFITNDIRYVGVNDHQVDLFEGQYVVPSGMAYNSYFIKDSKTAVMDTVDARFGERPCHRHGAVTVGVGLDRCHDPTIGRQHRTHRTQIARYRLQRYLCPHTLHSRHLLTAEQFPVSV